MLRFSVFDVKVAVCRLFALFEQNGGNYLICKSYVLYTVLVVSCGMFLLFLFSYIALYVMIVNEM